MFFSTKIKGLFYIYNVCWKNQITFKFNGLYITVFFLLFINTIKGKNRKYKIYDIYFLKMKLYFSIDIRNIALMNFMIITKVFHLLSSFTYTFTYCFWDFKKYNQKFSFWKEPLHLQLHFLNKYNFYKF